MLIPGANAAVAQRDSRPTPAVLRAPALLHALAVLAVRHEATERAWAAELSAVVAAMRDTPQQEITCVSVAWALAQMGALDGRDLQRLLAAMTAFYRGDVTWQAEASDLDRDAT